MTNNKLTAVILAGGESSRMGQDKGTLYSSKLKANLIEHNIFLLSQIPHSITIISGRETGQSYSDIYPNRGPISGIHSVLSQAAIGSDFLFLPVDMPNLTIRLLMSLIEFGRQHQCSAYINDSFLPLYVSDSQDVLPLITKQINNQDDWSVRTFCRLSRAKVLRMNIGDELANVNNPQDWQQHCV